MDGYSPVSRALIGGARLFGRFARAEQRAMAALTGFAAGLLGAGLDARERARLCALLYADLSAHEQQDAHGLFEWEAPWLARDLPPRPARILLCAAGSGREAAALIARGYVVDGLEPVARAAAACARKVGRDVVTASYEDLNQAVLNDARNAAHRLTTEIYDAVILGWGSLGHVLDASERTRLMQTCRTLCPTGPILASFVIADTPPSGRGWQLGRRTAALLGRSRARPESSDDDLYWPHVGFVHAFTTGELHALAQAASSELQLYLDGYPHATFALSR